MITHVVKSVLETCGIIWKRFQIHNKKSQKFEIEME